MMEPVSVWDVFSVSGGNSPDFSWKLCSDTLVYILHVLFSLHLLLDKKCSCLPSSVFCWVLCFVTSERDHLLCYCKYFLPPLCARPLFLWFRRPGLWLCTCVTGNCICWLSKDSVLSNRCVNNDIALYETFAGRAAIDTRKRQLKRFLVFKSVKRWTWARRLKHAKITPERALFRFFTFIFVVIFNMLASF